MSFCLFEWKATLTTFSFRVENSAGFMESPGQEWATFRLGVVGKVVKIQVDTTCFKVSIFSFLFMAWEYRIAESIELS